MENLKKGSRRTKSICSRTYLIRTWQSLTIFKEMESWHVDEIHTSTMRSLQGIAG